MPAPPGPLMRSPRMKDPAVDAYIAGAATFARPILVKIRALFHRACPGIGPSVDRGGMIGIMAAFKAHGRRGRPSPSSRGSRQDRRDPRAPDRPGRRMDGPGHVPAFEVPLSRRRVFA